MITWGFRKKEISEEAIDRKAIWMLLAVELRRKNR